MQVQNQCDYPPTDILILYRVEGGGRYWGSGWRHTPFSCKTIKVIFLVVEILTNIEREKKYNQHFAPLLFSRD